MSLRLTSRSIGQWTVAGALVALVFGFGPSVGAQNPTDPASPRRPQEDMTAMGRGFRTLTTQVKDATKNEASLALVSQLEQQSVSAKDAVPPLVAALPDAERATKLVAYKKEMVKLIRQELDLEDQLLSGDNTKAAETVAALSATMQEGHTDFRPARGRGPARGAPPAGRQ